MILHSAEKSPSTPKQAIGAKKRCSIGFLLTSNVSLNEWR